MRYNSHTSINKLSGNLKKQFNEFKNVVDLVRDTNSYSILVDIITSNFDGMDEVIPGTIGAYCYGKFHNVSFDEDDVCTAVAAGAIPSYDGDTNICKHNIVIAESKGSGYRFSLIKPTKSRQTSSFDDDDGESVYYTDNDENGDDDEDSSYHTSSDGHTFVFIPMVDEFEGFSNREKKNLMRLEAQNIKLYGFSDDGKNYHHIKTCHVNDIRTRKEKRRKFKTKSNDNTPILLFGIVIIVLFVGGFLYANKRRYGKM